MIRYKADYFGYLNIDIIATCIKTNGLRIELLMFFLQTQSGLFKKH